MPLSLHSVRNLCVRPVCEACVRGLCVRARHVNVMSLSQKAQPLPFLFVSFQKAQTCLSLLSPSRKLSTMSKLCLSESPVCEGSSCQRQAVTDTLSPSRKLSLCPLPPSDVSQKTHVNHVKAHVNEDLPKRLPKRGGMVFCLLVYVRKELTCLSLFTVSEICV